MGVYTYIMGDIGILGGMQDQMMEKQTEKNMEHEMDTGSYFGFYSGPHIFTATAA